MPANYTRTINWTGQNTGSGANYSWEDVNGAEAQGWITRSNTSGDVWNFNISDNTASNAVTRTATYRVKHWTYTDGQDLNTWDEFTITQYASGTVEVTTTPTIATTTTTTLLNNPTAATTQATLGTAATTQATAATAATTQATAATTQATSGSGSGSGSGGGSGETQATAATTLATNATTTLEPKTITWNGSTSSPADSGMALLKFVTIDSTSASGQTLVYASGSSGAGAGKLYWSSDATGATQVAEPSWAQVDSVTAFGTGSGVSSPDTSRVVITVDSYPAETTTTTSSGSGSGGGIGIR